MPAALATPTTATRTSTAQASPVTAGGPAPIPAAGRRLTDRLVVPLARHSITLLRIALGIVFFGFGVLKFFPGVSPVEELVEKTIHTLTLGIVHGRSAIVLTAAMECFIGLTLLTGKFLKVGLAVLGFALVGIMSPLVLFSAELFPHGAPTLTAQYVIKDIVLAAAGLVVAAKALGARLVPPASAVAHQD
jgi:uncharacterized membrane protein YkgB